MSQPKTQQALTQYREAMTARFADQLERLILFSSQARGEATAESDVDVLVVANWETERLPGGFYAAPFGDPRWEATADLAADICVDYGVLISPSVIS